jgi:tetratricopeptide (TPR) repeat protein
MKFCPECGARTGGAKFCPECGKALSEGFNTDAGRDAVQSPEPSTVSRSTVKTSGSIEDTLVTRSSVEAQGPVEDSVISRSTVKTDRTSIKDAVISHSTITQTETHQHFGESVGTFDTQMELGRTAYEGHNYEEAVNFFNAALKIDARGYEPWFLRGLSYAELRRTDEAVTNLRKAMKSSDTQRERVVDDIKGLVERTSKTAMVLETQATDLLSKADIELQYSYKYKSGAKAEKDKGIMGVLKLDLSVIPVIGPSMRTTSAAEGLEHQQEADKREAEGKKLEDQAKDLLSGAVKLYNSAIRFCDLVIEFNKEDEFSWLKRGEIFLRLKLYPDACKSYEAVLAFSPYHREALRLRGMCYTAQGMAVPPPPTAAQAPSQPQPVPPPSQSAPMAPSPTPLPSPIAAQAPSQSPQPSQPQTFPAPPQPSPMAPSRAPPQMPQQYPQQPMPPSYAPPQTPQQYPQQQPPPSAPQQMPRQYPQQPQAAQISQQQAAQPQPVPGAFQRQQQPQQIPGASQKPQQPQQQPQMPQPVSRPGTNPCPYCRGEMSFVRERNVWFCGACRRFSDRPAR